MTAAQRGLRRGLLIALALGALMLGVFGYQWLNAPKPAADYADSVGGKFALSDPQGRPVTDATLRGKPYAIFFGFTRCPDVCPTTLSRMARLRQQLGTDGDKFAIVFVTVDPERDAAPDLARYLTLFDTPIIGARGTAEQTAAAVKAFHVYYDRVPTGPGDYTIDHTASVFLMNAEGRFVATIAHDESQDMALAKLKRLVAA